MTFLPAAALLLQLAAEAPRGAIAGRIVSVETGTGLAGVPLQARAAGKDQKLIRYAASGPEGAFLFDGLEPGEYAVWARKPGHQAETHFPVQVRLDTNQRRDGLVFRFHRFGVITGAITNADGEPVIGAQVKAYRVAWEDGHRKASESFGGSADDQGRYRLFGLPAGRYVVAASAPDEETAPGDLALSPATYFPSGANPSEAAPVTVRWGQEVSEIRLTLRPRASFAITGRVADALAGGPCRRCTLRVNRLDDIDDFPLREYGTAPDGSYRVRGLVPGVYRVSAETAASPGKHQVSSRTVTVQNRDVTGVNLVAGIDRTVSGRVILQSPPPDLDLAKQSPLLEFREAGTGVVAAVARLKPDLTFEASGLSNVPYRVRVDAAGGRVKAFRIGGQDLPTPEVEVPEQDSINGLEVFIAFDGVAVAGSVQPPEGAGEGHHVTAAVVVLWPEDNQSPYLAKESTGAEPSGSFRLEGVPAGSYTAFALPVPQTPDIDDPDVRQRLANYGRPVRVERGKPVSLELPLAPALDVP